MTGDGPAGTVPVRARVMSAAGRDDAALRWYTSEHGPKSPLANAAPGLCAGCGFFVRLAGPLGRVFGACANEYAPDDGRVVSVDHGCGAHSEAVFPPAAERPLRPVIDELGYDLVEHAGCLGRGDRVRAPRPQLARRADPRPVTRLAWPVRALAGCRRRRCAARARDRFSRGTYHSANSPITRPATQGQSHQRSADGRLARSAAMMIRATAQAPVRTAVTSRSLASSGGGAGRSFLLT